MSITLGTTEAWGSTKDFTLDQEDRSQHVYLIGQSGTGKTTLLENMMVQDIEQGRGVGFIDPHGDQARRLLDLIPPHRMKDVLYFHPADYEYPIGFNPIRGVHQDRRHTAAASVISSLKGIWSDVWGTGRMQYIVSHTLLALLEHGKSTFLGVNRMYLDSSYREKILRKVKDPAVLEFWRVEFPSYTERLKTEAIAPIQNKIGQFLATAPLRNIIGQVRSAFDLRYMMDHRKIFIANLSTSELGEDYANILGSFLVSQFQTAAMSRGDVREEEREDFSLFVDEFQRFKTSSFSSILSEARKFHLNLTIAHQFTAQLSDEVRDAVFGNVGTLISFRVGGGDAELLAKQFSPYEEKHLVDLDNYTAYIRPLTGGEKGEPQLLKTFPSFAIPYGRGDFLIDYCRERYATPRAIVERKIEDFFVA